MTLAVSLIAQLRELEPDIRRHLRRWFPEVQEGVLLQFRPLRVHGSHHMVVVEASHKPVRRLLIKGSRRDGRIDREGVDTEWRMLTEVAPRISAQNPSARCPRALACYPDQGLLLMEMVDGDHLNSLLFGLGSSHARRHLPELLGLCGEWLAGFHTLTQSGEKGNPFEWLVAAFEDASMRRLFARYADEETYREICHLAGRFGHRYRDFRRPRCRIHNRFGPAHVLVQDGRIYVIDLATGGMGYAYHDLAYWAASYDILLPWRRVVGASRAPLEVQKRLFLAGYLAHATPLDEPDGIIMRLARLQAIARFVRSHTKSDLWRRDIRTRWVLYRFRAVCREELKALWRVAYRLDHSHAGF